MIKVTEETCQGGNRNPREDEVARERASWKEKAFKQAVKGENAQPREEWEECHPRQGRLTRSLEGKENLDMFWACASHLG